MGSVADRRERSKRTIKKRKAFELEKEETPKAAHRPCTKSGCNEEMPRCCLQSSDNCCRDGYTSRWYHMSLGEHFCNECFDFYYRPSKGGFPKYDTWYRQWYLASKIRPYIKRFVADEVMPFWLQCTSPKCGKWREVHSLPDLSHDYISHFECSVLYGNLQKDPCAIEEESCISDISNPYWIQQLSELPLLKNSPAAPFLKQFCEEGIGHCPISSMTSFSLPQWIEPFAEALNGESLVWPCPNNIEAEEQAFIPLAIKSPATVLALRNLVVSVWNMFPQVWLTKKKVSPYVTCRGLVRVYLLSLVDGIIEYLTRKGTINFGIVSSPLSTPLLCVEENVIVIGGGLAGLSAAKHLNNLGLKTLVLESQSVVGGCVQSSGTHSNIMTINGVINNPLTVLCHQAQFDILDVSDNLLFITDKGKLIAPETTDRMLHQFSGMMHGALEWSAQQNTDSNWFDIILSHQQDFHKVTKFSAEEDMIFEFLLKLTDINHRTNCKHLTLKKYEFPPKMGLDGIVVQGLSLLVQKLASELTIMYNTTVQRIKLCGNYVEVFSDKKCFRASRVLVAVPLPVLRDNHIVFEPPLPEYKTTALMNLGTVTYKQIVLKFSKKFWEPVLKGNYVKFGILSSSNMPFQYFIDMTSVDYNKQPTLVAFITDSNIDAVKNLNSDGILDLCYTTLKNIFQKLHITVPKPNLCDITSSQDEHFSSCGTFVKVGSSYDLYDQIAANIKNRIFFAGEATFRKNPNSLTGAYLSGLREAANIVDSISPIVPLKT